MLFFFPKFCQPGRTELYIEIVVSFQITLLGTCFFFFFYALTWSEMDVMVAVLIPFGKEHQKHILVSFCVEG